MSDYSLVKSSKLSFKGDQKGSKKHKKKRKREDADGETPKASKKKSGGAPDPDMVADRELHGGWQVIATPDLIRGAVTIEVSLPRCYMRALDNGRMVVGPLHASGEPPDDEEVLMAVPTMGSTPAASIGSSSGATGAETAKIALKTGFGKYICADAAGRLRGTSDAIGPRELFEPVYQEGRCALLAHNGKFLTILEEDPEKGDGLQEIRASSDSVTSVEMVRVRALYDPERDAGERKSAANKMAADREEDRPGVSLSEAELAYVKRFQSFQDGRLKVARSDFGSVREARKEGTLHAAMLDRREKMKSDKFCK